jgi:diacylglycerol kinase family enzyme
VSARSARVRVAVTAGIVRVGFAAVRLRLVVNPVASRVTAHERVPIEDALSAEHDVEVVETGERGDARDLARDAAAHGFDAVVVLGGDGTLNEAAGGVVGSTTAIAALPGGSTNVFARTLGVEHDPLAATRQLLRALAARSLRRVGVGVASPSDGPERTFLFHAGCGFDAAIVAQMEQRWYVKRYLAHPAFAWSTIATWLRHYDRATQLCVAASDERVASGPYVVVSNSDPYTYVVRRRLTITPDAGLDRALALTVLHHLRPTFLVRAALSGLGNARFFETSADVTQRADLERVVITGDRPFPWQVDGDYLGYISHLTARYQPDALTLVMP